ncbi:unnamed protein product [Nezara viridula]|uniref:Uncharacterized protein n=1 Tax=Nezara viridula TaxID=85310 RepID=A0A9P0EGI1_NEZVI|nr:unnamed protein product [Nezara viridula]
MFRFMCFLVLRPIPTILKKIQETETKQTNNTNVDDSVGEHSFMKFWKNQELFKKKFIYPNKIWKWQLVDDSQTKKVMAVDPNEDDGLDAFHAADCFINF